MTVTAATKKVEEFLRKNAGANKPAITKATKIGGLALTNVIKRLRKEGKLIEEGEGADLKLSISAEPEAKATPSPEVETPVEDEQTTPKGGRNLQKYTFLGQTLGKGPLVRAVVAQYVKDNPKVTTKQLAEVFPPEGLKIWGIWREINEAKSMTGARDRFFFKEEHQIKLANKTVIVCSNQHSSHTISGFLKIARSLYKIGLAK